MPPLLVGLLKDNSITKEMECILVIQRCSTFRGGTVTALCASVLDHTLCIVNAADRKQVNGVGADGDLIAVTWFIK